MMVMIKVTDAIVLVLYTLSVAVAVNPYGVILAIDVMGISVNKICLLMWYLRPKA